MLIQNGNCRKGCPHVLRKGNPGMIGGGVICGCPCHPYDPEIHGPREFPCGNARTSQWAGIDPDYRRWLGFYGFAEGASP